MQIKALEKIINWFRPNNKNILGVICDEKINVEDHTVDSYTTTFEIPVRNYETECGNINN